jgi:hypothetical protein
MTPTVETLKLSGLREAQALHAANSLLSDRSRRDLSRLLILDDTSALNSHADAFERLLTARRVQRLLCVAVGPRAGDGDQISLPGSISSGRGSLVLWVSDPLGVDWRMSVEAVAVIRGDGVKTGLHHLIDVLTVPEVFDRICEIADTVSHGVASPGLRLAGVDTEAASFPAALAAAIRIVTEPGSGSPAAGEDPWPELTEPPSGSASLTGEGELAAGQEAVSVAVASAGHALDDLAGISGLLGAVQPGVPERLAAVGTALSDLETQVAGLLSEVQAPGAPSQKQLSRVSQAGVRLPEAPAAPDGRTSADPAATGADTVVEAVGMSLRGGDTLPRVSKRLAVTERRMGPRGSASYLPEVAQRCPAGLVRRLTEPPALPPPPRWLLVVGAVAAALAALAGDSWGLPGGVAAGLVITLGWSAIIARSTRLGARPGREQVAGVLLAALVGAAAGAAAQTVFRPGRAAGIAGLVIALVIVAVAAIGSWRARVGVWRRTLALGEASRAADALLNLVVTVAAREWSGRRVTAAQVVRARIAVDGVAQELREHADRAEEGGSRAPSAARRAASLVPVLRDLLLVVLTRRLAAPDTDGRAAFERARSEAAGLIAEWSQQAQEHGALSSPSFAGAGAGGAVHADEAELAEATEAICYDPRAEMWQLCAPDDLSALNLAGRLHVVAFASRVAQQALAGVLPEDVVPTSVEQHAGLLRLVPLHEGIVTTNWAGEAQEESLP